MLQALILVSLVAFGLFLLSRKDGGIIFWFVWWGGFATIVMIHKDYGHGFAIVAAVAFIGCWCAGLLAARRARLRDTALENAQWRNST